MESDINIADILKNKPQGTKLYTDTFGELTIVNICSINKIGITLADIKGKELWFYNDGRYSIHGEPILFPSNIMRDWSKFAWQKGDVLVNEYNAHVIFEKFEDNTYTTFIGRHYFDSDNSGYSYIPRPYSLSTNQFHIEEGDAVQIYISNIEKEIGGKLNLRTLEARKDQPKFKDGDIVVTDAVHSLCYSKCIFILKGDLYTNDNKAHSYIFYNINNKYIDFDVTDTQIKDREIRLATDLEKLQLFDMLTVKGKYWDAAKKQIIDFQTKVKFKPFDKIVAFEELGRGEWICDMFSHYAKDDGREVIVGTGGLAYTKVLPFNKKTAKLIGTTKDVYTKYREKKQ